MADTLFFVHPDESDSRVIATDYRLSGWDIVVSAPATDGVLEHLVRSAPIAAVFCLDASYEPAMMPFAQQVMADDRTRRPIMVFVEGTEDQVALARSIAPYGIFVHRDELAWVLRRLVVKN